MYGQVGVFSTDASRHVTYDRILCFFFNDTATTEIYTLSLHDALPISYRTITWIYPDA